ncbi:putative fatty acyl-CoA reductase CG5065 [Orussus abietinus]|uniref:putative fatty acyl-CoA reductase CG5065 n=1 Tax=Orussus abietinus TaxID=222816 RepID=UPI0006266A78|nr:putative fatty acyl-CoA reductase CG5065 [Orussus abietinus]
MQLESIQDLISNSCILLTGVTGFVGGTLLERILRIGPGPEKVFVLVRKRQHVDPQVRFNEILSSPLFSDVDPERLKRVQVIPGDITEEGLGLSSADSNLLISKCNLVLHSAAFISFAAQLEMATRINLLGSRHVLGLAKNMPNIRAMVHVSTAYANCTVGTSRLDEKLYPTGIDSVDFIHTVKNMTSQEIERRTAEFIENHPNTYTFSKQMAENLLAKEREHVPLAIVRPSIVLNTWKVPKPGWVDNVNSGACAFIAGVTKGLFRTFQGRPDIRQDVIPADMVVSTILASALYAARHPTDLHIFHCTSSMSNPSTWGKYCEEVTKFSRSEPCKNVVWYPDAKPRSNFFRNAAVMYIFQLLPAHVIDLLGTVAKRKNGLVDIQHRYIKGCKYTAYFAENEWVFSRKRTLSLINMLSPEEREAHPMDPALINWSEYFKNCVIGMRRYFHKEPAESTESACRQMARLRIIAAVTPYLSFYLLWTFLYLSGCSSEVAIFLSAALVIFLTWL